MSDQDDVASRVGTDGDALQESEERFRRLFVHGAFPQAVAEIDGTFVVANDAFCALLGYDGADVLLREGALSITHPDDRAKNETLLRRLESGEISGFELDKRYIRRDGRVVWVRVHVRAIPDDTGKPRYVHGVVEDRTAARHAEDLLAAESRIAGRIAAGEPLRAVLHEIAELCEAHWRDAACSIEVLDPDRDTLHVGAAPSLPAEYVRAIDGLPVGPKGGACGTAVHRRAPVVCEDIATDPLWEQWRDDALAHGLVACWSVPILAPGDEPLGAFAVYPAERRAPRPDEWELLRRLEGLTAVAIRTARSAERDVRHARREALLAALLRRGGEVSSSWLEEVAAATAGAVGADAAVIVELAADGREAVLRASWGAPADAFPPNVALDGPAGAGLVAAVTASNRAVIADDLPHERRFSPLPAAIQAGARSAAGAAVRVDGDTWGAVIVLGRRPRMFVERDADTLQLVADGVAGAVAAVGTDALRDQLVGMLPERADAVGLVLVRLSRLEELEVTVGEAVVRAATRAATARLRKVGFHPLGAGHDLAVLVPDAPDVAALRDVAARVEAALCEPVVVGGLAVALHARCGAALGDLSVDDPVTVMLRRARVAAERSEHEGRGHAVYDRDEDDRRMRQLALAAELYTALSDNGEFVLEFQPQFDADGRPLGVEALVRWEHPERGRLAPAAFLPVAESSGLMRPLSRLVLAEAVKHADAWRRAGVAVPVSVNLAAEDMADEDFPGYLAALVADARLSPAALVLEVTEAHTLGGTARAILQQLADLGFPLHVDDFGTGYSSLAYLKDLPVDAVKIDRAFVRGLPDDRASAAIVGAVVQLAHGLGLRVIAEGVEDARALEEVRRLGCDGAQGYHLARPLPAWQVLPRLRREGGAGGAG